MKRINYFLFLFLCLTVITSFAQKHGQAKIDSLSILLITDKEDTNKVIHLNDLATELRLKNPDTSLVLLEVALSLSQKIKWNLGIGISYNGIAEANLQRGNYYNSIDLNNKAIELLELLEKETKTILDQRVTFFKLSSINNIGLSYKEIGKYNDALICFKKVLDVESGLGVKKLHSSSLNNIGIIYKEQGDYSKAIEYFLKAVRSNELRGDKLGLAKNYGSLAIVYWLRKAYATSLEYNFKALNIYEELEYKNGIASCLGNIANIYKDQNNYSGAMENYLKSLKIMEEIQNKNGIAIQLGNIGVVYQLQKDFENALDYFLKSLAFRRELNAKKLIATCLFNIGTSYFSIKKFIEAEKYMLEALFISDSIGNPLVSRNICEEISNLYFESNNYQKAFDYYKKAMNLKDSLFNEDRTKEIARLEIDYEFDKKQDSLRAIQEKELALAEAEKLFAISKSETEKKLQIAEADKRRVIAETEQQRTEIEGEKKIALSEADKKRSIAEADKKRAVSDAKVAEQKFFLNTVSLSSGIIILSSLFSFFFYKRKRDAEQKQKETSLSLQVSETEMKALRSQMNPHFVFNALQSIQSFLLSHKSEEANIYLLKFSKLMRAVLENSQHREISLEKDLQALELYMQLESIRLPHPFTYKFHVDESVDLEETTVPPLILQPFVENAIWHGLQYKKEVGHIDIYLIKKDNALFATVEDNGVGRDMSKKVEHPMLNKKESLGMKLTEERLKILNELKKIKAQFKITDLFSNENLPAGTKVELSLPLSS